ncbi:MAG: hypothetical protein KC613_18775 [Myxococcales bacterium]|nr:hypothetical protein [Myxococcales bacterium]
MTPLALGAWLLLTLPAGPEARFPWLADHPVAATQPLSARFAPPAGFERVPVEAGSFPAWLRDLPLRTDRTRVLAYDGRPLLRPSAAVAALDVGQRDLQQCADTLMRVRGEYHFASGRAEQAGYHFTSGDLSTWAKWRRGERFKVQGSRVARVRGGRGAAGHAGYRQWLTHTFRYAGTQSLKFDSEPVGDRPYRAGDFFVQPGGPGHAVVLLDLAAHPDGRVAALVGQGFMPAEDLHVLAGGHDRVIDGVWFLLPTADRPHLATPSWAPFHRDEARRFKLQ